MRILAHINRFRLRWHRDMSWAAAATGIGLGLEAFGRGGRSELLDGVSVAVLLAFTIATIVSHRRSPLAAVKYVSKGLAALGDFLKKLLTEFGIDFRGKPPLPRRIPGTQLGAVVVLAAVAVLVSGDEALLGIRNALADVLYVGNVVFLGVLWGVLVLGTFVMLGLFLGVVHDELTMRLRPSDGRRFWVQITRLICVAAVLSIVGFLLPTRLPALLILAATGMSLVWLLPFGPRMTLLWRGRGRARRVYATSLGVMNCLISLILGLTAEILVLLTQSGGVVDGTSMPFTTTLGMVFGWSAAAGLLVVQIHGTFSFVRELREDPARPCPPVLHVGGPTSPELRSYIERGLRHYGWEARFAPEIPGVTQVRVVLDPGPGNTLPPSGSRRVTVTELERPDVLRELGARDISQRRRLLRSALKGMLGQALRRSYRRGTGFWVNPQHWFSGGITRDTEEDDLVSEDGFVLHSHVGRPYREAVPRPVRSHLFEVLQSLELDLLYLEDGVSFERFWTVMERLFAVHDETGSRVEEHQLSGVPGVRTLIHDFVLEDPMLRDESYPEPDYEDIGRARILHVFKDVGEEEEPVDIPVERIPRPLSLFPL